MESSDRAQRALRRASLRRESGHCQDTATQQTTLQQRQQGKRCNDRRSTKRNDENPPSIKAVAHHSTTFAPPPLTVKSSTTKPTTTTAAALPLANSTNDRKRSATSSRSSLERMIAPSPPIVGSVARNTRSKKHRSGPPPPPAQAPVQAPQGDVEDNDATSAAEAAVAYRLKSAVGAAAAATAAATATVTPAVPRRQILFGANNKKKSQVMELPDSGTTANNTTATISLLPDGVVNIYPPRSQSGKCTCVAEIFLEQRAGFLHAANYGEEWHAYLRDKENIEYPMGPSSSSSSSSSLTDRASPFSASTKGSSLKHVSSTKQADDSPDSTASKSSSLAPSSLSSSSSSTSSSTAKPSLSKRTTPGTSLLRFDVRAAKDTPRFLEETTTTGNLQRQPYITAQMRAILVSWLVEVGSEYDISDQAFHLAITLLDVMLAKGPTDLDAYEEKCRRWRLRPAHSDDEDSSDGSDECFVVQRSAFQALGCACAWIASKMEDRNPPLQNDFVYISDQSVSSGMLRRFEKRICKELQFNLHRLTPIHYANSFLRASNACPCLTCPFDHPVLRQLFLYLIELARIPVALIDCPPSLVAAAAIYLARATLGLREEDPGRQATNNTCYWTKTLQHYTGYAVNDLKDTVLRIYEYQLQAEQLAIAPYIKYRSKARLYVSLKTVLRVEDLGFDSSSMGVLNHDTLPLITA